MVFNDKEVWTICSKDYVKIALENIQGQLKRDGKGLTNRAATPMISDYPPELDESDELDTEKVIIIRKLLVY